jgi:hypothetical protein
MFMKLLTAVKDEHKTTTKNTQIEGKKGTTVPRKT